ncbi:MAG: TonB-dependent receptor [Acidobacteria bacterium]|nr:TonB-dependent receptor [Acidobacteriota bacterium]MBI3655567.1 TonB-dependent receptor [Acidobacteriota bacterium]
MHRHFIRVLFLLMAAFLTSHTVYPQAGSSSAELKGKVADQSEAVLPGATVTVTQVSTSVARSLITDERGEYRAAFLPPGSYEVKAEMPGFSAKILRGIELTVGQTSVINIKLTIGELATEVSVTGAAPLIEIEKTQQADVIDERRIQNLPINGRNYLDYAFLTPGVTDSNALITFSLAQTPTSGVSVGGQSGRSNNVSVDGADNNDYAVGTVRSTLSQEAVQEFQVNRSNFTAEFGKASGGLINIVSKSGTNEYHGNLFAFLRNKKIQAREYFSFSRDAQGTLVGTKQPFTRLQPGFTFGGPLRKDKTFFFVNYEALTQHESRIVSIGLSDRMLQPSPSQLQIISVLEGSDRPTERATGAQMRNLLTITRARYPFTFSRQLGLEIPNTAIPFLGISNNASLRIDHKMGDKDSFFFRYNFTNSDNQGLNFGGLRAPSRGSNLKIQDHAAVVSNIHIFNPKNINEFRFQYADRYFNSVPTDPYGPAMDIFGVAFIGRDFFIPSERRERRYQWADNFSFTRGRHDFKAGLDISHLTFDTDTRVFFGGRFAFTGIAVPWTSAVPGATTLEGSTVANLVRPFGEVERALTRLGRQDLVAAVRTSTFTTLQSLNYNMPAFYQQGFGNPVVTLSTQQLAFYIQDGIKVRPGLFLNLGLRYDVELQDKTPGRFLPNGINRDKNNFGPRVGFSWDPFNNGKTIVRGGYGIYYAPLFQAISFVGRVLDGTQIVQLVAPLRRIPGVIELPGVSARIFSLMRDNNLLFRRTLTPADLEQFGLRPGSTPPAIFTVPPNIVNPYSHQVSFGIEREVVKDFSVTANYMLNRGVKQLRSRNANLRLKDPRLGDSPPFFDLLFGVVPQQTLIDRSIAQLNYAETSGSSIYHGLAVGVNKRFSRHFQFLASYSWSKAIDDTSDFISDLQPNNQLDLRNERSLSSFDQRQRFVLSGVLDSPFKGGVDQPLYARFLTNIVVAPILTIGAGHPFNLLFGDDLNGDLNFNVDRPIALTRDGRPVLTSSGKPIFAGRNTGVGPDFISMDVRVAKRIGLPGKESNNLELIVEAFNLFNHPNFSGINPFVGVTPLSDFRAQGSKKVSATDPLGFTSAFAPRQFQVAVKLNF